MSEICIDVRPLQTASRDSGIGIYGYFLVKNLLTVDLTQNYSFLKLKNYSWDNDLVSQEVDFCNVYRPRKPERFHTVYDYLFMKRNLLGNGIKVFHMLHPSSFVIKGVKNIVTCHDLIPLRFPDIYLRKFDIKKMYRIALDKLSKCDKILCVSKSVKQDLIALLGVDEGKLVVIYNGIDPSAFASRVEEKDKAEFLSRYGIKKNYILHVGGIDYRKNVISAVKAFIRCCDLHRDFQMVIVGSQTRKEYNEINEVICKYNKQELFVFTGLLPRLSQNLRCAYQCASAFIYPSTYEGFGLPPLEAMACGVPVITSNTTSLPEVVGEAAITVNPISIDEMTEALKKVIYDEGKRNKLIEEGRNQIQKFSWQENARSTLDLYRGLM